jgi:hypothetical protein
MIRFSDELKGRATEYAGRVGISLNALVSVALNEYLLTHSIDLQGSGSKTGDVNLGGAGEQPNKQPRPDGNKSRSKNKRGKHAR